MRRAHKRGADVPRYGEPRRPKRSKTKSRGSRDAKTIVRLMEKALSGDKSARKQLQELHQKREASDRKERRAALLKRLPILSKVEIALADGSDLFDRLCDKLLEELDVAVRHGYDRAPRSAPSGGSSGRGDTWDGVPAGSFIVTPYSGPPAPGPSGLS